MMINFETYKTFGRDNDSYQANTSDHCHDYKQTVTPVYKMVVNGLKYTCQPRCNERIIRVTSQALKEVVCCKVFY